MFLRAFILLFIAVLAFSPSPGFAQLAIPAEGTNPLDETLGQGGFAKPYEYERQAYGYDPEGLEYKENQLEDFQVIFFSSAPFAAGASFLLTSAASLAMTGHFQVGGGYFWPFIGLAFVGTTTISCVSVLTNPYPPPGTTTYVQNPAASREVVFQLPLLTASF